MLLSLPLNASAHPAPRRAAPRAAARRPLPPQNQETVFFTVQAGGHSVLGRCDSMGGCKAYLGPWGRGWQSFPSPALDGDDLAAASAPDGSRFALITGRGGAVNLWLVDADGMHAEPLTDDDSGILPASAVGAESLGFSPDGKTLAYIDRGNLWVVDLANRQARTLTFDGGVRAVCWSPEGDALAVIQNDALLRVPLNGGSDTTVLVAQGCQPLVAWSRTGPDDLYFFSRGAQRVDTATRDVALVFPSNVLPNSLALLPDGVALIAPSLQENRPEVFLSGGASATTVVHAGSAKDSGGQDSGTQVTQGGARAVWASLDGKTLYFLRNKVLWRCGLDGGQAKPLGAVAMSHVSVGLLPPLPGGCR